MATLKGSSFKTTLFSTAQQYPKSRISNKFSGIIIKDNDSYLGKVINTNKVILTYHPAVEAQEAQEEYFSYIDDEGNEKEFSGIPEFDLENNSYFGYIKETSYYEEVIDLFKEN